MRTPAVAKGRNENDRRVRESEGAEESREREETHQG